MTSVVLPFDASDINHPHGVVDDSVISARRILDSLDLIYLVFDCHGICVAHSAAMPADLFDAPPLQRSLSDVFKSAPEDRASLAELVTGLFNNPGARDFFDDYTALLPSRLSRISVTN